MIYEFPLLCVVLWNVRRRRHIQHLHAYSGDERECQIA